MKGIIQVLQVCKYQLCILSKNFKVYTIPVCLLIFILNALDAFREFLAYVNEPASPFLFPFLFSNVFLTALMFAGALLFYVDAPFYDKNQLYVIMRCDISKWILGQMLYVFVVSALYMFFLIILSVAMLIPQISISGEWGRIWTTLAATDARYQFGLSIEVPSSIIFGYTPLQAVSLVFFLGFLICCFYGFLVWCLNLYMGKILSLVIALASIILVTRVRYFPAWVMYLVPSAWANISNLSEYTTHGISIQRAILILVIGIVCFGIVAFCKTLRSDIAK